MPKNTNILLVSAISFSLVMWSFSNIDIIKIFTDNMAIINFCEYVGGYSTISFILLGVCVNIKPKMLKKVSLFLLGMLFLAVILFIILDTIGIIHLFQLINYTGQATLLLGIYFFILIVINLFKKDIFNNSINGISYLIVTGLIDSIKFEISRSIGLNLTDINFAILGIIFYICDMLYSYLIYANNFIKEETERKLLFSMAYEDQLTKLANRAKCFELLDTYDLNEDTCYSIINFDLNNLKKINDTKGHDVGDNYICAFATLLSTSFKDFATVYRMGGDEFIAITQCINESQINNQITTLKKNSINYSYNSNTFDELSFSYGVCIKDDNCKLKSKQIYEKSDKKMYENKQEQKKSFAKKTTNCVN